MEIIVIKRKQWIFLTSVWASVTLISSDQWIHGIGDRVMPQNNHRAFRAAIILTGQNIESVYLLRAHKLSSTSKFQLLYSDLTYRPQIWRDESHIVPACDN